jgi:adenylosuccinate lyase
MGGTMIPRYTREVMKKLWSEENKLQKWLDVEIAALEGWSNLGVIPRQAVDEIKRKAKVDVKRMKEIEKITGHDIIAFVEQVSETVGEAGRYIHYGLTSSDILDTSLALLLREAGEVLLSDLKNTLSIMKKQALRYRDQVLIGRSHGIHAEPITLGFKFAGWYFEFKRNLERMERAVKEISVGKISGAVGTFSNVSPEVETYVCEKFFLKSEKGSTQIISRDRYAAFISALGVIASSCEKVALQVRLLQQTEISELAEPFGKGQKGSSAMPHKRNPILCERICGLARIIKKNVNVALDNVALWHERDISHSSAERIILPESSMLLDYILNMLNRVLKDVDVFPEKMKKNLHLTGDVFFSQKILNSLVLKGFSRKDAYEMVQKKAFEAVSKSKPFRTLIEADNEIKKAFSPKELEKIFDIGETLKNLKFIFEEIEKEKKLQS